VTKIKKTLNQQIRKQLTSWYSSTDATSLYHCVVYIA